MTPEWEKQLKADSRRRLRIIKTARGIKPNQGYKIQYIGIFWMADNILYYVYEVLNERDWETKTGFREFALINFDTEEYRDATRDEMFGLMYNEYQEMYID